MTAQANAQLGTGAVLWDLQPLYPSVDSPEIQRDMSRCREMAAAQAAEGTGRVADLDAAAINRLVERLQTIDTILARLGTFAFLHFITQTGDAAASALLQQVEELEAAVGRLTVFFRLEWNQLDGESAKQRLQQPVCTDTLIICAPCGSSRRIS